MSDFAYSEIAGLPGHRCGECRYFHESAARPSICLLIPPKPDQRPAWTSAEHFCPAWEPKDGGIKNGCLVDLSGFPFTDTDGKPTPVGRDALIDDFRKTPRPVQLRPGRKVEFTSNGVALVGYPLATFHITLAQGYLYHAHNCPCRTPKP